MGLNGEHSLGDSPSDSPGKLLLRGKGAVSVYVILVKGVCVQLSTHFGRTLPLVMRSRSLSTNEFSVFLAMRKMQRAFPSVSVVEDLPCSSGDTSSVWAGKVPHAGKIPHVLEQLNPCTTTEHLL